MARPTQGRRRGPPPVRTATASATPACPGPGTLPAARGTRSPEESMTAIARTGTAVQSRLQLPPRAWLRRLPRAPQRCGSPAIGGGGASCE
eukprot:148339-Chlamydomonas_euryale.AAC.1